MDFAAEEVVYVPPNADGTPADAPSPDAILAASDADYDSFKEIVDLVNSVDLANDDALAAAVLSINNSIAATQADVDQNEADADTAIAAVASDLSSGCL